MENLFRKKVETRQDTLETNDYLLKAIKESEHVKIPKEYKDVEGNLLSAPNGPKSKLENELHWKMVRTDSFKKWFGNSYNKKILLKNVNIRYFEIYT